MSPKEKRSYLEQIRARYHRSSRKEKQVILDEYCKVCCYHRKHAIRLLNHPPAAPRRRTAYRSRYSGAGLRQALEWFSINTDQLCSKRLKQAMPHWLPFYERHHGAMDKEDRTLLLAMSPATIDRRLALLRRTSSHKGLCGTKPGSMLRTKIPIRSWKWKEDKAGFMQGDTVAHCGDSLEGEFVWSLDLTDIKTGWTECRGVWNKGGESVRDAVHDIRQHLPFALRGLHTDSGSEFLNNHFLRYFAPHKGARVAFTRSRPSYRNDNPHVEQKNWAHPRQLLGYQRIADRAVLPLINDLYTNEWSLLQNHFMPSAKLLTKTRIASRYHKTYDLPQTPYQRVLNCPEVPAESKRKLRQTHATLDPIILRKAIRDKVNKIFTIIASGNTKSESTDRSVR